MGDRFVGSVDELGAAGAEGHGCVFERFAFYDEARGLVVVGTEQAGQLGFDVILVELDGLRRAWDHENILAGNC